MTIRRPDPVDDRILRLLVRNARATWREIGDEVGLSANAAAQRVRRLERAGWVRGYTARLDPALTGPTSAAVVLISTATHVVNAAFENALAAVPEVVEVLDLAGPSDYLVRVEFVTQRELYEVVNTLRAIPGVTSIETRPVLREVVDRRRTG
jgi:Lrp/AsnC family transcriptional regulator, leucine-responsive regulatory protein